MAILFALAAAALAVWALQQRRLSRQAAVQFQQRNQALEAELAQLNHQLAEQLRTIDKLNDEVRSLARYREIVDVRQAVQKIQEQAQARINVARQEAEAILKLAQAEAQTLRAKAEHAETRAAQEAQRLVDAAEEKAKAIAGQALEAMRNAEHYQSTVKAMKNIIQGYGDHYIVPLFSLLDELGDQYGFTEAGDALKRARERTRAMIKQGAAATCEYVEANRKETAIRFVVDAFNGKVDSILSSSKTDNFGTLQQKIIDAYNTVNYNGAAFRDARITSEYLDARLGELKWACAVLALRERDRDEQRRLKEQIREEERARRDFERAMKDAAKEEEMLRKAMEKVSSQVAKASEEQKAFYEQQLQELQTKLLQTEEKNQRALSMAQQTKSGHVYVISNIGSFGEEVFKIGMTRRLEPLDRIRELGDASVPFPFDVHALIWSDDAPALETTFHRRFLQMQVNKVNPRKEFFRLTLQDIRSATEAMNLQATWTMMAEAAEYRESLTIEQRLKEDPSMKQAWLEHQLENEAELFQEEAEGVA
ncbi:MAG: DUF4041 domain-containing protein [Gammaproteobacteria bacterium]|nr:DUF4041 domain-containing protein [Gammaproteobacteria bacterium]